MAVTSIADVGFAEDLPAFEPDTSLETVEVFAGLVGCFGFSDAVSWRTTMVVAGLACAAMGIAYFFLTQDAPDGNFKDLRAAGKMPPKSECQGSFLAACRDPRGWRAGRRSSTAVSTWGSTPWPGAWASSSVRRSGCGSISTWGPTPCGLRWASSGC